MWVFDIPAPVGLPIFVLLVVGASCAILLALRGWVQRASAGVNEWDRVLSYAVGAYGIFYGVTLGLIAAGSYGNFTEVEAVVLKESSSIAVVYRNAALFPEPEASALTQRIVDYTEDIVNVDWPMQAHLIQPEEGSADVTAIHQMIADFHPADSAQSTLQAQTMSAMNTLITDRRQRIALTDLALPGVLWVVLGVGAAMNAVLIGLIDVKNRRIHLIMASMIAAFVALLLYAIAGFDHAYAGPVSVTADNFKSLLSGLFRTP